MLPVRRAAWPSIWIGSSSRSDQPSTTGPSSASWTLDPNCGSKVSWSMIEVARVLASPVLADPLRLAEERRADDLVGQLLVELGGLDGGVDRRRRPRREVVEAGDAAAEDDGRLLDGLLGGVGDRALEPPVLEPQVGPDERHVDGALGPDRPQRPEADAEVADPRRVALEHVEAGPPACAPPKSPLIGVDSSAPPGTRTW